VARAPIDQIRALWSGDAKPILWLGAGASCQAEPPLPTLWSLVEGLKQEPIWENPGEFDDPYQLIDAFVAETTSSGRSSPAGRRPSLGPCLSRWPS
jgi:hypothetical protein